MRQQIDAYLEALGRGDVAAILALFTENAMVLSPVYGTRSAKEFYEVLAGDTRASELTFKALYPAESGTRCALHFTYTWHREAGDTVTFDCVDLFELDEAGLFTQLQIIYDTAVLNR